MGKIEPLLEPVEATFPSGVDTGHSFRSIKLLIKLKD